MHDETTYAPPELSGQPYVDMYAASVKERAAAEQARRKAAPGQNADGRDATRLPGTRAS
jgi:1-acyl-sn-glycerol-3-phosphate acyltransferase